MASSRTLVTVRGEGLGDESVEVWVNGKRAELVSNSENELRFHPPVTTMPNGEPGQVVVRSSKGVSNALHFFWAPRGAHDGFALPGDMRGLVPVKGAEGETYWLFDGYGQLYELDADGRSWRRLPWANGGEKPLIAAFPVEEGEGALLLFGSSWGDSFQLVHMDTKLQTDSLRLGMVSGQLIDGALLGERLFLLSGHEGTGKNYLVEWTDEGGQLLEEFPFDTGMRIAAGDGRVVIANAPGADPVRVFDLEDETLDSLPGTEDVHLVAFAGDHLYGVRATGVVNAIVDLDDAAGLDLELATTENLSGFLAFEGETFLTLATTSTGFQVRRSQEDPANPGDERSELLGVGLAVCSPFVLSGDALFAAGSDGESLIRLGDRGSATVVASLPLDNLGGGLNGTLLVSDGSDGITRVDPATGASEAVPFTTAVGEEVGSVLMAVESEDGTLWINALPQSGGQALYAKAPDETEAKIVIAKVFGEIAARGDRVYFVDGDDFWLKSTTAAASDEVQPEMANVYDYRFVLEEDGGITVADFDGLWSMDASGRLDDWRSSDFDGGLCSVGLTPAGNLLVQSSFVDDLVLEYTR